MPDLINKAKIDAKHSNEDQIADFSVRIEKYGDKIWHTAFCDAIRMELLDYAGILDFDIEHPLTKEPLRVDVLIIKKKKNVVIDRNIAAIFRGRNISVSRRNR
ncbi:MAG: hypothetical protein LBG22_00060 [Treponema sp.]|jgi:hypothetical protein|nr:hypothetical protein [Treponema sp.]